MSDVEDESLDETPIVDDRILNVKYVQVEKSKRITSDILTLNECARIIGVRAQQIASGAMPMTDVKNLTTAIEMAEKELKDKKCPFLVTRELPVNNQGIIYYEVWDIREMVLPQSLT